MKEVEELFDIADQLKAEYEERNGTEDGMFYGNFLDLAEKIMQQRNIKQIFVLDQNAPTALEAIAIALGFRG